MVNVSISNENVISTDILIIGGGAGGLMAALSAKRHGAPGTRVTLVDTWMSGRTGHTAFSNATTVVVSPDDDLDGTLAEIVAGNDWVADQPLLREVLGTSYDRLKDLEQVGVEFQKDRNGQYIRRATRGLELARLQSPVGGGLEFCWRLRRHLEEKGINFVDRVFITGLMKSGGDRVTGAVGVHSRTGIFHVIRSRTTIICTNSVTFRSGFVRDITGTGTLLAFKAGAHVRNAEFGYLRPGTPRFYFEGITFAIQEGARFVNASGEQFMNRYEPEWGDESDVPQIARAMAMERRKGNDPLYLDMSGIAPEKREEFVQSKVKWMEYFFRKLGSEARTDMFGKTPYYPMNQMTKMGIRTDGTCRSDVPGLLSAGLAQAGCANHFAGFHIGMCIGTGWIAGRSAVEDLDSLTESALDVAETHALRRDALPEFSAETSGSSDALLRKLQSTMFAYDVAILKRADRLEDAISKIDELSAEFSTVDIPHTHELVRIKETEAMILAAQIILKASLARTESRLSHFREDYEKRDDENWLTWLDFHEANGEQVVSKTPIPTPLCPIGSYKLQGRNAPGRNVGLNLAAFGQGAR